MNLALTWRKPPGHAKVPAAISFDDYRDMVIERAVGLRVDHNRLSRAFQTNPCRHLPNSFRCIRAREWRRCVIPKAFSSGLGYRWVSAMAKASTWNAAASGRRRSNERMYHPLAVCREGPHPCSIASFMRANADLARKRSAGPVLPPGIRRSFTPSAVPAMELRAPASPALTRNPDYESSGGHRSFPL